METARTVRAADLPGLDPGLTPITRDSVLLRQTTHDMLVACLWSQWSAPGEPSFATISEELPPEMSAAGRDG